MAKDKAKKANAEDLRAKSPDELAKLVAEMKKQQFNLRFQKAGGQVSNTAEIRAVRRAIARVKTIAVEKASTAGAVKKAPAAKATKKTKAATA